ncbi:hypothetical protein L208DRAFT_1337383, partial [Tricholoma matsutake]
PLPVDDDNDFPPSHKILEKLTRPSTKVAGARHSIPEPKGKGKQNLINSPIVSQSGKGKHKAASPLRPANGKKQHGGHMVGVANYSVEDLDALFDILEERVPLGGHAWNSATDEYNAWAQENGRPSRTVKSLKLKFKQLVKTAKPTGEAEVPPHVKRAHAIDDLMNEKAGSRDLDDQDIVNADPEVIEVSESKEKDMASCKDDKKVVVKVEKAQTGPLARRLSADRISAELSCTRSRNNGQALLANISQVLDPSTRRAHAEEQSVNTLQTGQIFTLSSQLRESQRQVEALRNQLADAERHCHNAERRADHAELMEMITESHGRQVVARHPLSPHRAPRVGRPPHGSQHTHHHFWQEIHYADGGHATRYLGSDDDDAEVQGEKDSPGTQRYTFDDGSVTPRHGSMSSTPPSCSLQQEVHNASPRSSMSPHHCCQSVSV